jgi:hypothetical protein
VFDSLIKQRFLYLNKSRLECREYFSSERITQIKKQKAERTLIILGFPTYLDQTDINNAFKCLNCPTENIILEKKQKDDSFTGKVKVIFKEKLGCLAAINCIKQKDVSKFPLVRHCDLNFQRESQLLQAQEEKRSRKQKNSSKRKIES